MHQAQRAVAAALELADDVAGDAPQPGVEAATPPGEALDVVERPCHRLADGILGGLVIEEAAPGEAEQRPVGAAVQRLPGVRIVARRMVDEPAQGHVGGRRRRLAGRPGVACSVRWTVAVGAGSAGGRVVLRCRTRPRRRLAQCCAVGMAMSTTGWANAPIARARPVNRSTR